MSQYVYRRDASIKVNLELDNSYWKDMCTARDFFFEEHVAPELLTATGKLKNMDAVGLILRYRHCGPTSILGVQDFSATGKALEEIYGGHKTFGRTFSHNTRWTANCPDISFKGVDEADEEQVSRIREAKGGHHRENTRGKAKVKETDTRNAGVDALMLSSKLPKKDSGLYDALDAEPQLLAALLCKSTKPTTADSIVEVLKVMWAPEGYNRKEKQKDVFGSLSTWMEAVSFN
ncbi:Hypp6582 [Branchiostoma lanceolatum]|uniref:Hypp6582 protein n=1 Tax=Branchiostoma lanceolatum TaxID=7740 RepID=A0A8J9YV78_BRALA|nr:Hypp6582 [Branchiostoma lanceolatum]